MKRITALLLGLSMAFLTAFAALMPSAALLGDVDGDGAVYADDARQILRFSAKLTVAESFDPAAADVNKDTYVHADDARLALRISAKLEETELFEEPSEPSSQPQPYPTPRSLYFTVPGFGESLFDAVYKEGKNTLVSPMSVYISLAMLSAGADGNTFSQLEKILGADYQTIKTDVAAYMSSVKDSGTLTFANSVWLCDDELLNVKESFIKENADIFGADVFKEHFDSETVGRVNGWVKDKTDDMIPQIISEFNPETMLMLINAMTFDCEWWRNYQSKYVKDGVFNNFDGSKRMVSYMRGSEEKYIESGDAVGFIKDYKDPRYSFVGLMPSDANIKLCDFVQWIRKTKTLHYLIHSAQYADVNLTFPKLELSFSDSLVDELSSMGVTDAFLPEKADFNRMAQYDEADGSLCVGEVLHKTFISVTENGTKAAAVTDIVIVPTSAPPEYRKTLVFDRPFVFAIWDNQFNVPLFIGAVEKL
ncbi:MAG: hypothetical protein K6G90_04000 [Clostridia bacterium]|nr:hypothetical protein [Clostridia bacterium]